MHCNKGIVLKIWRWAAGGFAAAGLLATGALWATSPKAGPDQTLLPPKTPYTKGAYFAYSQPWGAERSGLANWWSPLATSMGIDTSRFPDNTTAHWRWPPFAPRNGPGVWSYQAVMHGNYDGGETETPIPPRRVHDVQAYSQDFAWTIDEAHGQANVLTEFYLRSSPTDSESKLLEVGWLLHTPEHSRKYFEAARKVGTYTDPQGRTWDVRIDAKYCMFAPQQQSDIPKGTIDMRAALTWLQQTGLITGNEWLWGVALGAEAISGTGQVSIQHWSVKRI